MTETTPRLRMFAGPNGSGKTTVKNDLRKPSSWFGIYINPDDLEKEIRETGGLSLEAFNLTTTTQEIQSHFASSELLQKLQLDSTARAIECRDHRLVFGGFTFTAYHASALSDFLRKKPWRQRSPFPSRR